MAKRRKAAKAKPRSKTKPKAARRSPPAVLEPAPQAPVAPAVQFAEQPPASDPFPRLRAINAAFARALPPGALSTGVYEPAAFDVVPRLVDAADGRYRVDGSDWIMTVAAGRVVLFERARPEGDPAESVRVPGG